MFRHLFDRMKILQYMFSGQNMKNDMGDSQIQIPLKASLSKNKEDIQNVLDNNYDFVVREFNVLGKSQCRALVVYISTIVNEDNINNFLIEPLMTPSEIYHGPDSVDFDHVKDTLLSSVNVEEVADLQTIVDDVLAGKTALFYGDNNYAVTVDTRQIEGRDIEKPETETVVRGPKESFNEDLGENVALIRRKLANPNLRLEKLKLGTQTQTNVVVTYIKGVVKDEIVEEVKKRLCEIEIDGILESGYIEEFIEDEPFSPFPTIGNAEKPDKIAAQLLEGRVVVIVDGTPTVLYMPYLFIEAFKTSEDYYTRAFFASILRFIRISSLLISMLLPSLYVSIVSFHPELIPKTLAISVAVASEGVPFPMFIEVLMMGFLFEILREAGIRMPSNVGQAVSIVGALILGEAAISAGIVGAPVVIVTALTAIAGFAVPAQLDAITMLRVPFVLVATVMGLPGIITLLLFLLIHVCSLRSVGVPYLEPVAPLSLSGLKDVVLRVPWWLMIKRPTFSEDSQRQPYGQKPDPDEDSD